MQVIQKAAVRFVTGARRRDHMTPVLRELHWLPVRQRIRFKTAIMVCKCSHGLAPSYLASYCKPTSSCPGWSHVIRQIWNSHEDWLWTSCLEQLNTYWTSVTWHLAGRFQNQIKTFLFNYQLSAPAVFFIILRSTNIINNKVMRSMTYLPRRAKISHPPTKFT